VARRIHFYVANLPIRRALVCGPYTITPVENVEEVIRRLRKVAAEPEVTATGSFSVDETTSSHDAWQQFFKSVGVLQRLLIFAERCYVEIAHPTLQETAGAGWKNRGWHAHFPRRGAPAGVSWCDGTVTLERFLERAYPRLMDDTFAESTGLLLALGFYAESYVEAALEQRYLSVWTALELLIHRSPARSKIVENGPFNKIRRRLKDALRQAIADGLLNSEARGLMIEKLGELNRPSTWRVANQFFLQVFAPFTAQDVTEDEFRHLAMIRNGIVHEGRPQLEVATLVETLALEQRRLSHLVDRVILALLDERPNLMDFSWRVMAPR
jgi:hypothetical protein